MFVVCNNYHVRLPQFHCGLFDTRRPVLFSPFSFLQYFRTVPCGHATIFSGGVMRLFWSQKSRLLAILIISLTFFALTGCAGTPQDILRAYSPAAAEIANLFNILFWVSVAVFVLVEGLLVSFVLRYQRRAQDEHPEQYHGNTRLEVTWTLVPALILAVVFALTIQTMGQVGPTNPPAQGIPITVAGQRWWWSIEYPEAKVRTAGILHMPTGQVMNVALHSENVIHSFWVPSLMGKTDVMPGHDNSTWIYGNIPGTYSGQCTEYCGTQHANMLFRVKVQSPEEFQAWLQSQTAPAVEPAPGSLEATGKEIFLNPNNKCIGCHSIESTDAPLQDGPNLAHFASRECFAGCIYENNRDNLTRWLENPEAMKPGNLMAKALMTLRPETPYHPLTADQVAALTAYLESLK